MNNKYKIPIINKMNVRQKLLTSFFLVIIIFSLGLMLTYSSSQIIADTNDKIVNKYALIRARSYELSSEFQEQLTFMRAYSIGIIPEMKNAFTLNINHIDNIASQLENLTEDTNGKQFIDSIQKQRPIWINSVLEGVMSIPNQRILFNIITNSEEIKSFINKLNSISFSYILSGNDFYKSEINSIQESISFLFNSVNGNISSVESVNNSIFNDFSSDINKLSDSYELLLKNEVAEALTIGDNHTNVITSENYSVWHLWTNASYNEFNFVFENIENFVDNVNLIFISTKDYLTSSNSAIAPILEDLRDLRYFSEEEMNKLAQSSYGVAFITTFGSLIIGVLISIIIAYSISQYLSKPLIELANNSKSITNGDFSLLIDPPHESENDEIAVLKINYITMVNTIKDLLSKIGGINDELSEFAYKVSHDLKAPLRGINMYLTLISQKFKSELSEETQKMITAIESQTKLMGNLIDGILNYSIVSSQEMKVQEIDMNSLVSYVFKSISIPDHISISVDNDLPTIICENIKMFQVFQNIIVNAIKFIDKKEGLIKITFSELDKYWKFGITDNGPGIKEADGKRIFGIFETLDKEKQIDSTGIGLSIVKKIVEQHKGNIWVESELGKGATFFFTISKNL